MRVLARIAIGLLSSSIAFAQVDPFAPERAAIREGDANFVQEAERQLIKLDHRVNLIERLAQMLELIAVAGDLSPPTSQDTSDPSILVQWLATEIAKVRVAQETFAFYRSDIALVQQALSDLVPEAERSDLEKALLTGTSQIEERLQQKKVTLDSGLQKWIELVQALGARDTSDRLKRARDYHAFVDQIESYRRTAILVEKELELTLRSNEDYLDYATSLVDSLSVLRSLLEVQLRPFVTDSDRLGRFESVLSAFDRISTRSRVKVEKRRQEQNAPRDKLSRADNRPQWATPDFDPLFKNGEPTPEQIKSFLERYSSPDGRGGVSFGYEKVLRPDGSPSFKCFFHVWHTGDLTRQGGGSFEFQKSPSFSVQHFSELSVVREVVSNHVRESVLGTPASSRPGTPTYQQQKENQKKLRDLLAELRGDPAVEASQRDAIGAVQADLDRASYNRDLFERELERTTQRARDSVREASQIASKIEDEAKRPAQSPDLIAKQLEAEREKNKNDGLLTAADFTLGMFPVIGNAYNFGSLVSAIISQTNLVGQPVSPTETALIALGVALPFASKSIEGAAKGTKLLGAVLNSSGKAGGKLTGPAKAALETAVKATPGLPDAARAFGLTVASQPGAIASASKLADEMAKFDAIAKQVAQLKPTVLNRPVVTRATNNAHIPPGTPPEKIPDAVFAPFDNSAYNHRMTPGGPHGSAGTYMVLGSGDAAKAGALREVGKNSAEGVTLAEKTLDDVKVLDLTDKKTRDLLDVDILDITRNSIEPGAYDITHRLGEAARNAGFDGVLYPAFEGGGYKNLVLFLGGK